MRPRASTTTRSTSGATASKSWVTTTMMQPRARSSARSSDKQRDAGAVEPGERLVGEQEARLVHQRARHRQPLQHAARVGARRAAGGVAQPDALEQRIGDRARVGHAVEPREEGQVLVAGEIAVAVRLVRDDADGAAQLVVARLAAAVAHLARRR